MIITFTLNGSPHRIDTHALTPLSHILRTEVGMAEFPEPCGSGQCGYCLVWHSDEPVNACLLPAFRVRGSAIATAQGLRDQGELRDLEQAFEDTGYEPCADCRDPLEILLYGLMQKESDPTVEETLDALRSLTCECQEFATLRDALHLASLYRRRRIHGS